MFCLTMRQSCELLCITETKLYLELLPKFNTWEPVRIERKKGSLFPFDNADDRFSGKKFCRYGDAKPAHQQCLKTTKMITC